MIFHLFLPPPWGGRWACSPRLYLEAWPPATVLILPIFCTDSLRAWPCLPTKFLPKVAVYNNILIPVPHLPLGLLTLGREATLHLDIQTLKVISRTLSWIFSTPATLLLCLAHPIRFAPPQGLCTRGAFHLWHSSLISQRPSCPSGLCPCGPSLGTLHCPPTVTCLPLF